jgi:hypothetical protein
VLAAAYRSLGRPSPTVADSAVLLRSLQEQLRDSLDALAHPLDTIGDETGGPDVAGDARKAIAGVQQTLDRLPPEAALDAGDAAARTLLAAAAEDTAWAWRMLQAPATSPAVAAAARVLAEHATGCCEEAAALLSSAPAGEPRDGA